MAPLEALVTAPVNTGTAAVLALLRSPRLGRRVRRTSAPFSRYTLSAWPQAERVMLECPVLPVTTSQLDTLRVGPSNSSEKTRTKPSEPSHTLDGPRACRSPLVACAVTWHALGHIPLELGAWCLPWQWKHPG